jgi:hypothetical protein
MNFRLFTCLSKNFIEISFCRKSNFLSIRADFKITKESTKVKTIAFVSDQTTEIQCTNQISV